MPWYSLESGETCYAITRTGQGKRREGISERSYALNESCKGHTYL